MGANEIKELEEQIDAVRRNINAYRYSLNSAHGKGVTVDEKIMKKYIGDCEKRLTKLNIELDTKLNGINPGREK